MATVAINDIDTTIGGDLGKNFFHIVGINARGAMAANREPGSQETFAMVDGRRVGVVGARARVKSLWRRISMEKKVLHAIGDLAATDVHSLNRNDMLINAKIYIDRLLRPNKAVVLPLS